MLYNLIVFSVLVILAACSNDYVEHHELVIQPLSARDNSPEVTTQNPSPPIVINVNNNSTGGNSNSATGNTSANSSGANATGGSASGGSTSTGPITTIADGGAASGGTATGGVATGGAATNTNQVNTSINPTLNNSTTNTVAPNNSGATTPTTISTCSETVPNPQSSNCYQVNGTTTNMYAEYTSVLVITYDGLYRVKRPSGYQIKIDGEEMRDGSYYFTKGNHQVKSRKEN